MDGTCASNDSGGYSRLKWLLLLVYLTGLQVGTVLTEEQDGEPDNDEDESDNGGPEINIVGPDYVTVGVPCSFECVAKCPSSSCTYSMAVDGEGAQGQGNVLAFTLLKWTETLTLTCTATDDHTGLSDMVTKKWQVLAGPANLTISGADMMNPTVSHSYSCRAYCRPSCNYSWHVDKGPWLGGLGNVIAVVPQEAETSKTIMCKATNSMSGLYVTSVRNVNVTSGPSSVHIKGPDSVNIAKQFTFICVAECRPSCRYAWLVDGQTLKGSRIDITVEHEEHHMTSFTLSCEAQNTVSKKTTTITKTVFVGEKGVAIRAQQTTAVLLCALIIYTVIPP